MGKAQVPVKPPNSSGEVIFYGAEEPRHARNFAEREIQDEEVKTNVQESKKKANVPSYSIRIGSTTALFNDIDPPGTPAAPQTNHLPLSIRPTQGFEKNEKKANLQCSSIRIGSTTSLFNDQPGTTSPQTNLLPLSIRPTQGFHRSDSSSIIYRAALEKLGFYNSPPSLIVRPDSPSNLRQHPGTSAQILLRLVKDACDIFYQVPYVKIVAGLVQEIIKISEVCVTF